MNENIGDRAYRYIRAFAEKETWCINEDFFFLILEDLIRFVGKEENLEVKDTEKRDN